MNPPSGNLTVAVITEVFLGDGAEQRLGDRLDEARALGAQLALPPELPLNAWCPATKTVRDEDAESPHGHRHEVQARAARSAGIGLVGAAIVRDQRDGTRRNRALVFGSDGGLVATYDKLHLPDEECFWEAHHYDAGEEPPHLIDAFEMPFGIQICSDVNRPSGAQILMALGAEMIFVPRATPGASYERWKLVLRALAVMCATYVISTNRPTGEPRTMIDGPSLAVDPYGELMWESADPVRLAILDRSLVHLARADYPGYLAHRPKLYASAWQKVRPESR